MPTVRVNAAPLAAPALWSPSLTEGRQTGEVFIVLDRRDNRVWLREVDAAGTPTSGRASQPLPVEWASEVSRIELAHRPRWVWSDTTQWYPELLRAGVRVVRCVDLRLSRAILRASSLSAGSELATGPVDGWDAASSAPTRTDALFDLTPSDSLDPRTEFARQRAAIRGPEAARVGVLLSAESAGALIAAEMQHAGLPWDAAIHDALLARVLGPRPPAGRRPSILEALLADVRRELGDPDLNPDSAPELLKALASAGISVTTTRSWELKKIEHPAIAPLVAYKKLARLLSANGWQWLDTNVRGGRFHPEFVPGGVVTGRWSSAGGGGAMQLPKQIRSAVVADPGWKFVVADAAQLEPRILAALSADRGMIEAGVAGDLYAGIVATGAIETREDAKVAMLGAMYGATAGESGRLMPRLARAYPKAIALVESAARAGERGEVVTTRLGRSSPPGAASGYDETADREQQARSRARARSQGRFTRNFIVQGTAAEWALCWMAGLRPRLRAIGGDTGLEAEPHLVFFLHDEVVVHTPAHLAPQVVNAIEQAAADAGRLLFGALPIVFPLAIVTVDDYGQAS